MSGRRPSRRAASRRAAALLSLAALAAAPAGAQQFYQVYEWETPMEGWFEPTLWTIVVPRSDLQWEHYGKSVSREGLTAHSLEAEYGFTDRLAGAVYGDFESAPGGGFHYTRTRLEARYRLSERYRRLFNPTLYFEYYVPRGSYDHANKFEGRLILERDFEDFRLALNPIVEKEIGGDTATKVEGALAAGAYWRRHYALQPGLELYGSFGPIGAAPPLRELSQVLFPTVTVRFRNAFIWNLGVGFGLTSASDRLTVKSIFTYELQTVRPSEAAP